MRTAAWSASCYDRWPDSSLNTTKELRDHVTGLERMRLVVALGAFNVVLTVVAFGLARSL
jgi:hypothetical protein